MILLEYHNVVLQDTLTERFAREKADPLDITFVDFDGVTYHLYTPDDNDFSNLLLSIRWRCFPQLEKFGAREVLEREYASLLRATPEDGWNLSFNLKPSLFQENRAETIRKLSLVKRNLMAAPFERAFKQHSDGATNSEVMSIPYRDEEAIFIRSQNDRITVIFSTTFKDETDRVFGKFFLQEFVDARRQPSIQNAPQVLYSSREPPLEIRHLPDLLSGETIGYVTFVLFPRHFESDEVREKTISQIQMFRDYLHYHIKCCKAYMHSRMRNRVSEFIKVLNRAKPERVGAEKKLASGRTFVRH